MKSMTCIQLGGACEQVFSGENFDELAKGRPMEKILRSGS